MGVPELYTNWITELENLFKTYNRYSEFHASRAAIISRLMIAVINSNVINKLPNSVIRFVCIYITALNSVFGVSYSLPFVRNTTVHQFGKRLGAVLNFF